MYLDSRAGGLWLLSFAIICVIALKDLARIELFEAGRLLDSVAHNEGVVYRRRIERLSIVMYLIFDIAAVVLALLASIRLTNISFDLKLLRIIMPVYFFCVFACLVFFRIYVTVWARAMVSNYLRLFVACVFGAVLGAVGVYYSSIGPSVSCIAFPVLFMLLAFSALLGVRFLRPIVRDVIFEIGCMRLQARKDNVERILVYGSGLRYRAFRREMVRSFATNSRIIVGLLDDNMLLHGKYIGSVKVFGGIHQAPRIINQLNIDAVVVACEVSDKKKNVILETLAETGVKISFFGFCETSAPYKELNTRAEK
jgi:FlaA1/EpsC-like NDP-sugar epimerase